MASATRSKRSNLFKRLSDCLTCRQILNIMVITGFMFNYMLRVNLNLAIVEMIYSPDTEHAPITNGNATTTLNLTNASNATTNHTGHVTETGHKFHWNVYEKNQILGSFFWGYILTELPGGRLSELIGARKVFGGAMLASSVLTLLTPVSCHGGYMVVAFLRALVGFFLGATFPATPPIAAKWIPPLERSKFIANMMASALGSAITMPVCGFLISTWGWESVFYTTGVVCLLWSVAWFLLVYDSPAEHPRISAEEREYLESKIAETNGSGEKPSRVPWIAMLTSLPVWAIVVTHGCSVFGYFMVVNELPTYMKDVLHFNIKTNGLLSSLPYLAKYTMAVLASYTADRLRQSGKYSTIVIRKAFTTLAVFVPGTLMIVQAFFGYIPSLSITIFTIGLFCNGAVTGGYLSNGLDIAPNFSGTIMGMANTLSSIGGWFTTFLVAVVTEENKTFAQWQYIFWILVGIYMFGGITFLIFGSGTIQPWNSTKPTGQSIKFSHELQPLNKKENEVPA